MSTRHGHTKGKRQSSEYRSWRAMVERCTNAKSKQYRDYGGRGIRICERWLRSAAAFIADMGPKPSPSHTLDRIDNDGDYKPSNCRWATRHEQAKHTRKNRMLTFGNETLHLSEWARRLDMHQTSLRERIERWGTERALATPRLYPKHRRQSKEKSHESAR